MQLLLLFPRPRRPPPACHSKRKRLLLPLQHPYARTHRNARTRTHTTHNYYYPSFWKRDHSFPPPHSLSPHTYLKQKRPDGKGRRLPFCVYSSCSFLLGILCALFQTAPTDRGSCFFSCALLRKCRYRARACTSPPSPLLLLNLDDGISPVCIPPQLCSPPLHHDHRYDSLHLYAAPH